MAFAILCLLLAMSAATAVSTAGRDEVSNVELANALSNDDHCNDAGSESVQCSLSALQVQAKSTQRNPEASDAPLGTATNADATFLQELDADVADKNKDVEELGADVAEEDKEVEELGADGSEADDHSNITGDLSPDDEAGADDELGEPGAEHADINLTLGYGGHWGIYWPDPKGHCHGKGEGWQCITSTRIVYCSVGQILQKERSCGYRGHCKHGLLGSGGCDYPLCNGKESGGTYCAGSKVIGCSTSAANGRVEYPSNFVSNCGHCREWSDGPPPSRRRRTCNGMPCWECENNNNDDDDEDCTPDPQPPPYAQCV